jgi:hypothetical protein
MGGATLERADTLFHHVWHPWGGTVMRKFCRECREDRSNAALLNHGSV